MTTHTDSPPGAVEAPGRTGTAKQLRDLLLVLLAGLALLVAGTAGHALAGLGRGSTPASDSAEAGFARDMAVHHAQAVQMSALVRDATDDPAIRYLAYDVLTAQQAQIGMMSGWLADWGLTQTDGTQARMAWMSGAGSGHHGPADGPGAAHAEVLPDGRMPGMASKADLDRLEQARGRDAEVLYLQLMVVHHRGGLDMAAAGVDLADRESVRTLAQSIVDSQTADIDAMQDLLRERGAAAA